MKTVIIKYNAGNIQSVHFALERLGISALVSDDIEAIKNANKVIFPGVGEASTAMAYLKKKGLDKVISELKQPVLGICLGMQLLCEYSEENNTKGIGVFKTQVKKFPPKDKVPHMGWNNLNDVKGSILRNLPNEPYVYFVHSYYAELCTNTTSITDYIVPFSASLEEDNFYGTQFHPEKSGEIGQQILKNFIEL
jgi:glutamine amidotransferase